MIFLTHPAGYLGVKGPTFVSHQRGVYQCLQYREVSRSLENRRNRSHHLELSPEHYMYLPASHLRGAS